MVSSVIGKTASQLAKQLKRIVTKANKEFNKEGPPDPKVINKLRNDYKETNTDFNERVKEKIDEYRAWKALAKVEAQKKLRTSSDPKKVNKNLTKSEKEALEKLSKETQESKLLKKIVTKVNKEFNKEGPPNPKVIMKLRNDYKEIKEYFSPLSPAKDRIPVMDMGDVPSRSIGAGEDSYSKGTTPFRPEDEPVSKVVSEGRDTGRKGYAQKSRELTIKGDRSVPFKKGRSKKDDEAIKKYFFEKYYGYKPKKTLEGEAGSFKQPKKPTPVDKQKKQIVSKAKKELDKGPPDPRAFQYRGDKPPFKPKKKVSRIEKSKIARLRKQYNELNNLSDKVINLLADPNFIKQQRTETQLKKLVGRYTPAQLRELMGASGTDVKSIERTTDTEADARLTGEIANVKSNINPEKYIASKKRNPLENLLKRKVKPRKYKQIIKNLQNASPQIQRLAIKAGIIGKAAIKKQKDVTGVTQQDKKFFKRKTKKPTKKNGQLELSFIPGRDIAEKVKARKASVKKTKKKTKSATQTSTTKVKKTKPIKKQIFKSKPTSKQLNRINKATDEGEMAYERATNRKKVNIESLTPTERKAFLKSITRRKKVGKVLKTKVKRKTTAPRKRAALRGYGAALRGF